MVSASNMALDITQSPFLQLLKTHDCIPTLKAQKVFAWFAVPFDQLFLDILEHDLRAEEAQRHGKPHPPPLTEAVASPATSVELSQLLLERDRCAILRRSS